MGAYLDLAGTGPVERSSHDIQNTADGDSDEEPRKNDGNQDDGADNARESVQEHAE